MRSELENKVRGNMDRSAIILSIRSEFMCVIMSCNPDLLLVKSYCIGHNCYKVSTALQILKLPTSRSTRT